MNIGNFLLYAALASGICLPSPSASGEITWRDNYLDAFREAKRTQKPIFLEFRCEA